LGRDKIKYGDNLYELLFYSNSNSVFYYFNIFNKSNMKISSSTTVGMPIKNMVSIMAAVAVGVYGYFELTARLTSLETSRQLFNADLLKKSEQLPTDQEQFMLIENLYKVTEKLEITQEQNMTNKVNIQFLNKQLEKALIDVEKLKDKVRKNGNGSHD